MLCEIVGKTLECRSDHSVQSLHALVSDGEFFVHCIILQPREEKSSVYKQKECR